MNKTTLQKTGSKPHAKRLDADKCWSVEGKSGPNHIPVGCLVKPCSKPPRMAGAEQGHDPFSVLIFPNGDVLHYFRHLAQAIAGMTNEEYKAERERRGTQEDGCRGSSPFRG